MSGDTSGFYANLAPMRTAAEALDERSYAPAPGDWSIAVSDIKGSTQAVAAGRHSDVNFAAAAMIASLANLCGQIPYQFGGDGAIALVPPKFAQEARKVLARARTFAKREFGLEQRVGIAPIAMLNAKGLAVEVAKYAPADGAVYAVFRGGGMELFERSVKGRADDDIFKAATIDESLDDGEPPDLTGLSCRWTPVKSARGRMVSLVVRCADHKGVHADLASAAGIPDLNAVNIEGLAAKWPPKGLMREAHARRGKKSLFGTTIKVALETLLAYVVVKNGWKIGGFDPKKYTAEVADGAVDFARTDDFLYMVFDCPDDKVDAVKAYLDGRLAKGELKYGMSFSDHAVMTCLVVSMMDGRHVHFVDGGDGGYTRAASQFKAQMKAA